MKEFTPQELLDRLEWHREVRNIMGRISHDYAVKQRHRFTSGISATGRMSASVSITAITRAPGLFPAISRHGVMKSHWVLSYSRKCSPRSWATRPQKRFTAWA